MSNQWQARRGTTAQNDAFTGASGEITYDTESQGLRVHDGTKQGGYLVDTVVEYQKPTAENNYTWYRLYASGWVEQGGLTGGDVQTITLPVPFVDNNYEAFGNIITSTNEYAYTGQLDIVSKSTTSFNFTASSSANRQWFAFGMAV
jgi:hypothetical protein